MGGRRLAGWLLPSSIWVSTVITQSLFSTSQWLRRVTQERTKAARKEREKRCTCTHTQARARTHTHALAQAHTHTLTHAHACLCPTLLHSFPPFSFCGCLSPSPITLPVLVFDLQMLVGIMTTNQG